MLPKEILSNPAAIVSINIFWAKPGRLVVVLYGPLILSENSVRYSPVVVGFGALRVNTDSFIVIPDGPLVFSQAMVGKTPVVATSLSGAEVNYSATASDNVGVTTSSCTPASGSTFSLGTTTVECTATDAAGNEGTDSFTVTVEVNIGSVGTLVEEIKNMDLSRNVEKNLIGPLKNATKKLGDNNPYNDGAACAKLDEFLALVQEVLADGNITQAQADLLSAFGQSIKDYLGCP